MEIVSSLDFDISVMSKGQLKEIAKELLGTDRVVVEPFIQKVEFDGATREAASFNGGYRIGDPDEYDTIYYAQSIVVDGGYWLNSEGDDVEVNPFVTCCLRYVEMFRQNRVEGVRVIKGEGVLFNDAFIGTSGLDVLTPYQGCESASVIQVIGWKAYRY